MPGKKSTTTKKRSEGLSPRTKKAIDDLPIHAKHIFKSAHKSALKQYKDPGKRQRKQSVEQTAHRVAWSAVKKEYEKEGDDWVKKD